MKKTTERLNRNVLSNLRRSALALAVCSMGILGTTATLAHHPVSAKFETDDSTEMTGRVTAVDWRNPHAHIFVNVEGPNGLENWAVELESPVILRRNGWDAESVKPGDELLITGPIARDGTRQIWGESITLSALGREVYSVDGEPPVKSLSPRPTPRWPDGQIALGTTSGGVDGYWAFPSETALVEEGEEVPMNAYGLLADIDDAEQVAPLQPWALSLYRHRQERALQDDPMYLNCKPPGGPRQYQDKLGFQLLEDRDNQRVFVLMGGGNHNFRIIYMDGRDPTGQVGGDDDNPLYYGRSIARWQDNALVVQTTGFNEDFWFSNGGLPHTDLLEMEERFVRTDADTLEYEVTIDDPGAYTRPWTASWTLSWVSGEDLPVHFCQNNRQ